MLGIVIALEAKIMSGEADNDLLESLELRLSSSEFISNSQEDRVSHLRSALAELNTRLRYALGELDTPEIQIRATRHIIEVLRREALAQCADEVSRLGPILTEVEPLGTRWRLHVELEGIRPGAKTKAHETALRAIAERCGGRYIGNQDVYAAHA